MDVWGNSERLNSLGILEIGKPQFIFEWKALLGTVISDLRTAGYEEDDLEHFSWLRDIYERIGGGSLSAN